MATNKNTYWSEIGNISLLSLEEEKALATRAFSGDKEAKNALVKANLRFVIKIANKYKGFGLDIDDLINEGNLGLLRAAEKFDPNNGTKFTTYAVWWIREAIQKAIRETSTGVKFPAKKFTEMKSDEWKIASLDKTIENSEDDSASLLSFQKDNKEKSPEKAFVQMQMIKEISEAVNQLKEKEQQIIKLRYGLTGKNPMSLSEIGNEMGFSKERIRQIENKALCELKEILQYEDSDYYDRVA